ncbi:Sirohydrochlorin cobaltochelatase CbiX(long) [hydrothermal vent metagenome]|uniref:Sirohydrochlorin cobaltochelatase CbiX(Long) n=1 Tax=hydrothermal vent metagenome TaxID=652676 RepID=A0A3B0ZRI7_9ZZZZ
MTTTILLVGHGSRDKNGNVEIEQFSTEWQSRNPEWDISTCYIEFAEILLDDGLDIVADAATANNSNKVIVVPLILNAAGHVKMEIPHHINKARERHAHIEFIYAKHLGAGEPILSILKRNLTKALASIEMPDPRSTGVIILGRGSSDQFANGELAKMARWLYEKTDHDNIDIAFTGITYPRLETVVQRHSLLGMTQVVILPYYLFTGTLIERIKRQTTRLQQQYPQLSFALSHYFGFENEIYEILDTRVKQATGELTQSIMLECDGCQYRELAESEGHHHNHNHDHHHNEQNNKLQTEFGVPA